MKARIGMVNFINTAPLYEVWKETVHEPDWLIIEAAPSALNRLLFANELDFGLVSSHEYGLHASSYAMLADLSISASGPVGSVFLFSSVDVASLNNQLVALSPQSQTSNSLVKIVLEDFFQVRPRYLVAGQESDQAIAARLAIGDEALRLVSEGRYPVTLDLGEVWHRHTGLPFVFAVWAVRREFCDSQPETVLAVHRELKRCAVEGKGQLATISQRVAARIPMEVEACKAYLHGMEYDLGPQKQEALALFFQYLMDRGEISPGALPLRFFS